MLILLDAVVLILGAAVVCFAWVLFRRLCSVSTPGARAKIGGVLFLGAFALFFSLFAVVMSIRVAAGVAGGLELLVTSAAFAALLAAPLALGAILNAQYYSLLRRWAARLEHRAAPRAKDARDAGATTHGTSRR